MARQPEKAEPARGEGLRVRRSLAAALAIYGPAVLLAALGFVVAYQFVDPAPPSTIAIATGGTGGAYFRFAHRYRSLLAGERVTLDVRATGGSVENLALLRDPDNGIDLAFVQGGVGKAGDQSAAGDRGTEAGLPRLYALGSVYFEPLWVFHRLDPAPTTLSELAGRRVAVGAPGSGTRALALQLLAENGITDREATLVASGGARAAAALRDGELDAVFVVAAPSSNVVQELLRATGVAPMSFARADAYVRRHPFLSSVRLPRGAVDLRADIPASDVRLLASGATLVATGGLHPAIAGLVLQAAARVHGPGGLFEAHGQFPSREFTDFPLSDEARRYYESGPPFLQRFMPFWAATMVDRMLVMLVPVVGLLVPLVRIMPPIYQWRMRARVYRWYRELLAIDPFVETESAGAGARGDALKERLAALGRIESEVAKVNVPLSVANQLYQLRMHIDLVRERLERGVGVASPAGSRREGNVEGDREGAPAAQPRSVSEEAP